MRNMLVLAFILSMVAFITSCRNTVSNEDEEPTTVVEVNITEQPEGGTNIDKVTTQFKIFVSDEMSQHITATKQWQWDINGHKDSLEKPLIIDSKYLLGRSTFKDTQGKSFLEGSYWFKITWEDSEGTHTIVSDTVTCVINEN